eukprot:scaffold197757_cov27-Tisochrysis_lutea.AAC.1
MHSTNATADPCRSRRLRTLLHVWGPAMARQCTWSGFMNAGRIQCVASAADGCSDHPCQTTRGAAFMSAEIYAWQSSDGVVHQRFRQKLSPASSPT